MSYRVVIDCPEWWPDGNAELLAQRLANTELPSTVGVRVECWQDGVSVDETIVRVPDPEETA